MAPIGTPRYTAGNTAAATLASASPFPRQRASVSTARPSSGAMGAGSSAGPDEMMPADVTPAPTVVATPGRSTPPARASRTYSMHPRTSSSSATERNTRAGANQTTAIAMASRTAPLRILVIVGSNGQGHQGHKGHKGKAVQCGLVVELSILRALRVLRVLRGELMVTPVVNC